MPKNFYFDSEFFINSLPRKAVGPLQIDPKLSGAVTRYIASLQFLFIMRFIFLEQYFSKRYMGKCDTIRDLFYVGTIFHCSSFFRARLNFVPS